VTATATPSPAPSASPTPSPSCTAVGSDLQAAINAAPNGATLCLTQNVTHTSAVAITSRTGLTIDGRGFTLTSSGYHAALLLRCSTNVTIRDLVIVGTHPNPGTYVAGTEHAHGVHVDGGTNVDFDGLDIRNMQGDGFYFAQCGTTPGSDATVTDSTVTRNGRMGIAVVAWDGLVAERMTYQDIAFHLVDVEPDWNASYQQIGTDLRFSDAVSTGWVGRFPEGLVDATAFYLGVPYAAVAGQYPPLIARVVIEGHEVQQGMTGIRSQLQTNNGFRMTDVTIRDNVGNGDVPGIPGGWGYIVAQGTDGLTVTGNQQDGTSPGYVVTNQGSTGLNVTGNTGAGIVGQVAP
jgi:hypothetical protein